MRRIPKRHAIMHSNIISLMCKKKRHIIQQQENALYTPPQNPSQNHLVPINPEYPQRRIQPKPQCSQTKYSINALLDRTHHRTPPPRRRSSPTTPPPNTTKTASRTPRIQTITAIHPGQPLPTLVARRQPAQSQPEPDALRSSLTVKVASTPTTHPPHVRCDGTASQPRAIPPARGSSTPRAASTSAVVRIRRRRHAREFKVRG